jgi:hypothetical protein
MKKQILLTIGLGALLASATQASQDQLGRSIHDAHLETARTSEQLKATLNALNGLTDQKKGDLRPAYTTFCAEVAKTEAAATVTRTQIQWMGSDGRHYFQDWQTQVKTVADPSMQKKAQKRLDSVRKSFDKVEESLKDGAEKFRPFLSSLSDIQRALATDVTAGGVKAIRSTVRTANWNHKSVDKAIQSALKEMVKMENALSPEAK